MEYSIKLNELYKSLEVKFNEKPSKSIIEALKKLKFRWNPKKSIWYGFTDETTLKQAIEGHTRKTETVQEFAHGVKVGDLFSMSWGYDQTNVDFFQVVKVSEKCAWVVEVLPELESDEAVGPMSADRAYSTSTEPQPRRSQSVFIHDQENGDRKTIQFWGDKPYLSFRVGIADLYHGETLYESWYA